MQFNLCYFYGYSNFDDGTQDQKVAGGLREADIKASNLKEEHVNGGTATSLKEDLLNDGKASSLKAELLNGGVSEYQANENGKLETPFYENRKDKSQGEGESLKGRSGVKDVKNTDFFLKKVYGSSYSGD